MGRDIEEARFTREDRRRYREKLRRELDVLRRMLEAGAFEGERARVGIEVEFHVVDADGEPMMINEQLLSRLESEDFQTELAQFNIEFNLSPHRLVGSVFGEIEEELATSFDHAQRRAQELDANVVMIGILPTLEDLHVTTRNLSANPRYHLLNEQILAARGEDLSLRIEGVESLDAQAGSITVEAAATSVQIHLQASPDRFARVWNAATAISAAQVAVGANSPFFLGKQLWQETRIAVFEQTIDTRTEELAAQGVRPRVWFGEGWVQEVTELFEENVRYFPALLPLLDEEDPDAQLAAGEIPHLPELVLHNGTIWRWNRPIYDVARGKPHLRVENRVLPAGPSVTDITANAAFYLGLVRAVTELDPPIDERFPFERAADSFRCAARDGLDAALFWPGLGSVPAPELILETLLPMAHDGLDAWKVDPRDRDRCLGVIERRCAAQITGAAWQVETFHHLLDRGRGDRRAALTEMTRRYMEGMRANEPVHAWPRPRSP